ncbi:MAG: ABC transporter permease [Actinomycetota bacterium]
MTPLGAQLRAEMQILRRNGEQLLLTLIIPVGLLIFFGLVDVLPSGDPSVFAEPVDFLTPGILALAVMSSAMVSLGISTGFERSYHVLKRLGVTPLGRPRWLAAKILTVLTVQIVQLVVLLGVALLLGWRPESARWLLALGAVVAGTTAFVGLGLTLAGRLRAEINLALQNALFLVLLLLGGMVIPFEELPGPLADAARLLPSGALADVLRDALVGGADRPGTSWIVLGCWAVAAPVVAALAFRWD